MREIGEFNFSDTEVLLIEDDDAFGVYDSEENVNKDHQFLA